MIIGSSNDPFVLGENARSDGWNNNSGYSDVRSRTLRSVDTSQKTLVLFTAGDSNMGSAGPSAYTFTNGSAIDNLNIYDGALYSPAEPLLGSTYFAAFGVGGISGRVADGLITAGSFTRVILVPTAVGGSTAAQWAAGGPLYDRIPVAVRRLAARGITAATTNVTFGLLYQIGANDTGAGTSQASFTTSVQQTVARAISAGFSGRVFLPTYSKLSGSTSSAIQAAQAALRDNVNIFDGGNIDALTSGNYQADGTHFNATGQGAASTIEVTAMRASGSPY